MRAFRFDWRWAALIVIVAVLANGRSLPWPVTALVMAGSGGYLLRLGWQSWSGSSSWGRGRPGTRVTYWRGQRIETGGPQRRMRPLDLGAYGPLLVYGLIGLALVVGAVGVTLRGLGV